MGGYGHIICADVSIYSSAETLIKKVENTFGKIDILVNNAGISKVGLFSEMYEKDWDEIINTNLKSTFNCCHVAVKNMIKRKSGCIINISSIWGNVGASCEVIYSASKGGINSFTKALSKELGPSGIRVNAIAPGVIDTSMNKWLTKEEKDNIINEIPLQSFGNGEDIGKLVVFLSSSESKYITGQIITVDGGMV
jgi:3-oxoacyl-[acyl-carrier protein] reductase